VKSIDELANHESPWNTLECLLFLTSYYSRLQIVPIEGIDEKQPDVLVGIEPQAPDAAVIEPAPVADKAVRDLRNKEMLEREILADKEIQDTNTQLSIMLGLAAFATFGIVYIYFNYFRRKGKAKKHII
jgi:hypothetical protein